MPWLLWISLAGIIYGALVALAQSDIKRLIAYSSVSHLGFCMLGLFALNRLGVQGSVLQMVNHGLSTGGLFAVVGMIYERYHTRQIADLGGLARRLPVLAFFMLVLTLSSIGLPGLNGFVGEFCCCWACSSAAGPSAPRTLAAIPRDRRAEPQRRGAGGVVHAVDVPAGVFRPADASREASAGASPAAAGQGCAPGPRPLLREVALPRAAGGVDLLDRPAAAVLPRPHGAHAR